ncbi:MAG: 50S ribosomal protein L3 [Nanobdellota archaeon]
MAKKANPRHGSMQFWPRVRSRRQYPRVRSLPQSKEAKLSAFAGYKAGMTHVVVRDNDKNSMTKNENISLPVTVIECPPLKVLSVREYTTSGYGRKVSKEYFFKAENQLSRKISVSSFSKAQDLDSISESAVEISVVVYTQPWKSSLKKKKPELFEMPVSGSSLKEKIEFVKSIVEKDIPVQDVLSQHSYVDTRVITTGRGTQGPVKRFGVGLRQKKSEKVVRGPGSLGGWIAQGHSMYRIAHAGTMGYHQRIQYNNYILSLNDDVSVVNPKGGFINYGLLKSSYILVKGSVPGPKRRLVVLSNPMRKAKQFSAPTLQSVDIESKQGN